MSINLEPPANPPAGWYEHPEGGRRWWDGASWSAALPPAPPMSVPPTAHAAAQDEKAGGIVVGGYIFAVLMPLIGFILGLVVATRPSRATSKHGIWIIVVSVVAFFAWFGVIAAGIEEAAYSDSYTY